MVAKSSHKLPVFVLALSLAACNLPSQQKVPSVPSEAPLINSTESVPAPAGNSDSSGGMQIRFTNLTDGGSISGTLDESGKPQVVVQFEVTGIAPLIISLSANGVQVPGEARNTEGTLPYAGELKWSPLNGGGDYDLTATAVSDQKQIATTTAHITVTDIPAFTATPPPLDHTAAQRRFTELYKQLYKIDVPAPSLHRFDSPQRPDLSRWISAVYYRGGFHYLDLYDDGHYLESGGDYADPTHMSTSTSLIYCRPAGDFKILVAFVDYGNITFNKDEAIADVPTMAQWMNQFYDNFAISQGFKSSPMHISAQGVYLAVPKRGEVLTAAQGSTATGGGPAQFNFLIEIDIDADNTIGKTAWKGILESGGGVALQGCGTRYYGDINIWSVVNVSTNVHGVLVMDFNHELSHLFGMMDSWPFVSATLPDGLAIDDWIPYDLFGWSDSDGDGVPEIIDTTPYGTGGS